ncbi:MAG: OsmC family peroxiredoxin [Actinobacteria bacterium]|nr:OsmC family peroxiredoxin [Actinomycetota bacterium]
MDSHLGTSVEMNFARGKCFCILTVAYQFEDFRFASRNRRQIGYGAYHARKKVTGIPARICCHERKRTREDTSLPFSLKSRTDENAGTNPEELIGAAHAGCFSMALTSILEDAGLSVGSVETSARVTLEQRSDGFWISEVHLVTRGVGQACSNDEFVAYAEKAKATCPVSKLYSSAAITLDAALA